MAFASDDLVDTPSKLTGIQGTHPINRACISDHKCKKLPKPWVDYKASVHAELKISKNHWSYKLVALTY